MSLRQQVHAGSVLLKARTALLVPGADDYRELGRSWRHDVLAGLSVGVVALPLALAFGISAGLGAEAGLITGIVAGLVAAVFGGSHVQVSGPTGAMTVVLMPIVAQHGRDGVVVAGLIAGVLVVAAGIAGLGRSLAYIPWPVIEGFTVGIAVIIFLQQVPAALGVPKPEGEHVPLVALHSVHDAFSDGRVAAIGIVLLTVASTALLPRLRASLPSSLVAIALATVVAEVASLDVARIGSLPSSLPSPELPSTSLDEIRSLFSAGVAIALLAGIESLLSAKVADGMTDVPAHQPDRELVGQGLANLVAPLFGGMPATGAIARTAVNVRAGARTRVAAIVHALVLVAVVLFGASLVSKIPLAALAGVLMVTAVRMVEHHKVRSVLRSTRSDAVVLTLTLLATVFLDLIVAVEVGVAVAAFLALRALVRNSDAAVEAGFVGAKGDDVVEVGDHIVVFRLQGALFFGAAQRFLARLSGVGDVRVVILRLSRVLVLDATGAQALGEVVAALEARGITVLLKGARSDHARILAAVGALDHLAHERHVFERFEDAIEHARAHVARQHALTP